jgi:2-haloacid dehalogenase
MIQVISMTVTLAFDVYGTLIDTHGVVALLGGMIGEDRAPGFSQAWRDKQLEYSFRRGLMQNYENFAVCTSNALDYTCAFLKIPLTSEQKQQLLEAYRALPAFDDVKSALKDLKSAGYRLFAFSNGSAAAVETLLKTAGIREHFLDVVSVDEIRSFKPDPAVYSHFLKKSETTGDNAWLISSNPFDVLGAISAGMKAAWVQRTEAAIFDTWGIEPTIVVDSLAHLKEKIADYPA